MPNRISDISRSLRELGEVQINEWDFMELLNRDIKDLEIGKSLRRLGSRKVMDWDFRNAMPTVHEIVHREFDLVDLVRRAAHYKVMDWEFGGGSEVGSPEKDSVQVNDGVASSVEVAALASRLRGFLQFAVVNLIDEPELARIDVRVIGGGMVHFKLLVSQNDVQDLIGRRGESASAIRNLLKAGAAANGVEAVLQILSHEEDRAQSGQKSARQTV